jgi:hypothetical protein
LTDEGWTVSQLGKYDTRSFIRTNLKLTSCSISRGFTRRAGLSWLPNSSERQRSNFNWLPRSRRASRRPGLVAFALFSTSELPTNSLPLISAQIRHSDGTTPSTRCYFTQSRQRGHRIPVLPPSSSPPNYEELSRNESRHLDSSQLDESEFDIVSGSDILGLDGKKEKEQHQEESSWILLKPWIDEVSSLVPFSHLALR